jgi:putative membrane protein
MGVFLGKKSGAKVTNRPRNPPTFVAGHPLPFRLFMDPNVYLAFKTLHIIGFVSWFAGLFYLVRLFIYHAEARELPEPERGVLHRQFSLMESRLYGIISTPAMVITWSGGTAMIVYRELAEGPWLGTQGWLHIKLLLVVLLTGYHHWCKGLMKRFQAGETPWSSERLRAWNEVATLFLAAIAMLAVYQVRANYAIVAGVVGCLALLAYWGILAYRKRLARESSRPS